MARAMWKGPIQFGLVNVPVRLYSATDSHDVSFTQVHHDCGGAIKYKRVCANDGTEVEFSHIDKGYRESPEDEVTIFTKEDLDSLPLASLHKIEVLSFIDWDEIESMHILLDRKYYVEPGDKVSTKPFKLFHQAMFSEGFAAIVKVSLRQREHLAVLQVWHDYFLLTTILWQDEVRPMDFKNTTEGISFTLPEVQMATNLIRSMFHTGVPDLSEHTDEYKLALTALIESKRADRPTLEQALEQAPDVATDLMALLTASVEKARELQSR